MYYPQSMEGMLTRRNVFAVNGVGLFGMYLGALLALASRDLNVLGLAHFLVLSGGFLAAFGSLMGALGSTKTTDLQNVGLMVWAGLVLLASLTLFAWIG
jgi:hypothetical protein